MTTVLVPMETDAMAEDDEVVDHIEPESIELVFQCSWDKERCATVATCASGGCWRREKALRAGQQEGGSEDGG